MTTFFQRAWSDLSAHRQAFLGLNVAFFGLLASSMAVTLSVPELQGFANAHYDLHRLDLPVLRLGLAAYANADAPTAGAVTFLVNLCVATVLTLLPSLLVPFIGILAVFYRALAWGAMFAPVAPESAILVPHIATVVIEAQGYVVAALAVYVHGCMVLRPERYGFAHRWDAYRGGLRVVARLGVVVALILMAGAAYEAWELIYLVPQVLSTTLVAR